MQNKGLEENNERSSTPKDEQLNKFFFEWIPQVYKWIRRMGASPEISEDLAIEVMISFYSKDKSKRR